MITTISVLFIAFVLLPVTWAGAYLFFDPPSTMLMMQRAAEGQTVRHYPVPLNRMSPHIVRAIGQAFALHGEVMKTGKPMEEVARALGMDPARGRQLHVLTHLSPAILKAASSEGAYLPCSIAITVWRVMPMRSASSACVISPCSKRRRRISLAMAITPPGGAR